jgi:hypothetical protein
MKWPTSREASMGDQMPPGDPVTPGDQMPEQTPQKSGYGSRWKKYVLIYILVAIVAYGVIWYLFFRGGGGNGYF